MLPPGAMSTAADFCLHKSEITPYFWPSTDFRWPLAPTLHLQCRIDIFSLSTFSPDPKGGEGEKFEKGMSKSNTAEVEKDNRGLLHLVMNKGYLKVLECWQRRKTIVDKGEWVSSLQKLSPCKQVLIPTTYYLSIKY